MANLWEKTRAFLTGRKNAAILPAPYAQSGNYSITGYGYGRLLAVLQGGLPGTNVNFVDEAGDLALSSAVAICLSFYTRNWNQTVVRVKRGEDYVEDHPVLALLSNPMPAYNLPPSLWWEFLLTDYWILGNNYIRKVRSAGGFGPPVALQFLPGDMVAPNGDYINPLTGYVYRVDGRPFPIATTDMIHIRQGRDPYDFRVGRSKLVSALREIAADNKGSAMAFSLAANQGHISMLVSQKGGDDSVESLTEDEARAVERRLNESITGDKFGTVKLLPNDFHAEKMSFSPREMAMDEMRKKPEERIAAIFGLPPVVVGFGAGLDRSTYNNFAEARQQAWEDGIMPLLSIYADSLTRQLLPDFVETQPGDVLEFDVSQVRALADDVNANAKRASDLFKVGIIDRAAAKRIAGEEADPDDEGVYATINSAQNGNESDLLLNSGKGVKKNEIPTRYP
jgi:HK97 family phage portal protein